MDRLPNRSLSVLIAALLAVCASVCVAAGGQGAAAKQVLVIDAYHQGLGATDLTLGCLTAELKGADVTIDYMDTKRITPTPEYLDRLAAVLAYKLSKRHYDLIIASQNDALDFVAARPELFGGIPIVHLGVNSYRKEMTRGNPLITGVAEVDNWKACIELGLRQNPGMKTVYMIGDGSATARGNVEDVKALEPRFPGLKFVYLNDGDTARVLQTLSKATKAIALLSAYNQDSGGRYYSHADSGRMLAKASAVPIYATWDVYMGSGVVGGMMNDYRAHGRAAGRMAMKVLSGTPPSAIPVDVSGQSRYLFDRKALRRFHIPTSRVPEGSRFGK